MKLLRTLVFRPFRRDRLRTALSVAAVALGVAVVVAVDLAADAATGSFRSSLEALTGKTDLEILANGDIDERWIGRLDTLPVNARFRPAIETQVDIAGVGSVTLEGVDLAGAPQDAILVSSALAGRLGLRLHSRLVLPAGWFTVERVVDAGSAEFLVIDIATAQKALGRFGKLDRIDVIVDRGEDFTRVEDAVRRLLPPAYLVEKPGVRNEENQRMMRAFRWNLRVLSYISLLVGAFLIYNTISVSVVRRRAEIGVLRALGASRTGVFALFLAEALILGLAGAALGVALGRLLAGGAVGLIAGTVNALYTTSRPAPVELTAAEAWIAVSAGVVTAILSAFGPAREAMNVPPTEAMSRGAREHHARLSWRRSLGWSVAVAAWAALVSQAAPLGGKPVGGYVAALLAVGAAALAVPGLVLAVNRAIGLVANQRAEPLLGVRSLAASLPRTSVVVAALATAIAMMASVGIMVASFRETVTLWLDIQLRADLYVAPARRQAAGEYPPLADATAAILASTPGVAAVDLFHALEFHYERERATLGAGNLEIVRRFGRLRFLPGENRDAILRALAGEDRAIVSEPFANKHSIRVGDRLNLPLGSRYVTVTVAGIYYEYSSSQGFVLLDRSTLLKYLPGQPATNAAVYLKPGVDATAVQREIERRTAGLGVAIGLNQSLRRNAIAIFDRTFAITWALEAVAIVVALLGAANSLLALVLDRRRELGLLRYLGASTLQLRGMILVEAGFLGLLAAAVGLALGFALSVLLVFIVNKQSFGWTIQFHPPVDLLASAILLVWCVTMLAGLYPARVAARLNPIDVIHEE